ncbi:hypothetical protein JOB18_043282 [Solea senegalensis]|uniref:Uncharacterized protein n=1 Tax=Solea senegalensis TaxID=28829 RepID=A0AAV6STC0_SOLSE|nr:hypothetical protein JOB18_043282 [Solea senegalensis]KAG7521141.1 hypothetical protein JOB18_043282 [Solea senegalensis]
MAESNMASWPQGCYEMRCLVQRQTGLTGDIQTCRDKREDGGWAIFHIFHVSGGFALGNNSLSPGFNVPQEPPGTFTRQWKGLTKKSKTVL